jgi:hypothetical protein
MVKWYNLAINLKRRSIMTKKKKSRIWKWVMAISVCLAVIALFAWVERGLGNFQWWHVYFMVGALIVIVLARTIPAVGRVPKYILKYVGFEKETSGVGGGVRREYFMALAPIYFIVSVYLMQAALGDGKLDIMAMSLSIVMLLFALNLVFTSFFRAVPEAYARATHQMASLLAPLGGIVFYIDLLNITEELKNLVTSPWYVVLLFCIGLLVVFGVMVFHIINVSGREW